MIKDFTKTNRWTNLRKKYKDPVAKEIFDHFEILEKQILELEKMLNLADLHNALDSMTLLNRATIDQIEETRKLVNEVKELKGLLAEEDDGK